jgi:hypothetical protein
MLKYTIIILLISITNSYAQVLLTGKIIDKETNMPIPYVNISVDHTSFRTSSNEQGEFTLTSNLPAKLIYSHVAYELDSQIVNKQENISTKLSPLVNVLSEVVISSINVKELINCALSQVKKYERPLYYSKALYRQSVKQGDVNTEFIESLYELEFNNTTIKRNALDQGRYAIKKDSQTFHSLSVLTLGLSDYLPVNQEWYTFKLEKTYEDQGKNVALISYQNSKNAGINGELYIDISTCNLLKYVRAAPLTWEGNKRLTNLYLRAELIFIPYGKDQNSILSSIRVNLKGDILQDNKSAQKFRAQAYTYFYDIRQSPNRIAKYKKLSTNLSDKTLIDKSTYDSEVWKNSVVKRTAEEDRIVNDFEKTNSFGRILEE